MDVVWVLIGCAACGAVGGFLGKTLPGGVRKVPAHSIRGPVPAEAGIVVSTLGGAVAAVAFAMSSEAFGEVVLVGAGQDLAMSLTGADAFQSITIGLVGITWLANHQDAATLRGVATRAAGREPDEVLVGAAQATPREMLRLARRR